MLCLYVHTQERKTRLSVRNGKVVSITNPCRTRLTESRWKTAVLRPKDCDDLPENDEVSGKQRRRRDNGGGNSEIGNE
jgi:hypothetical protein